MKRAKALSGEALVIENGHLRAVFDPGEGGPEESYEAADGGVFREIARSTRGAKGLGAVSLAAEADTGGRHYVACDYSAVVAAAAAGGGKRDWWKLPEPEPGPPIPESSLRLTGAGTEEKDGDMSLSIRVDGGEGIAINRRISLGPQDRFFRVQVELSTDHALLLERLVDSLLFSAGVPDFTWLPHLKYVEENVSADWSWKSPALILQRAKTLCAVVPDVDALAPSGVLSVCNAVLDLDVRTTPLPTFRCGLSPSYPYAHCLYRHVPGQRAVIPRGGVGYAYYLLAALDATQRQGYRRVVRFLWDRFGRPAFLAGHGAQNLTFSRWEEKTWGEYADRVWVDLDAEEGGAERDEPEGAGGAAPRGTLSCLNFGMKTDGWFCGWWNVMRTAYGMELYSRRIAGDSAARPASARAHERARRILNLALSAPRNRGAFPVLFRRQGGQEAWVRDHEFGGYPQCYHAFDMAWTAYWLLRWLADVDPADARILPLCRDLGDFLLSVQRQDGFIPSYFEEDLKPKKGVRLNLESAEPAACAVFLVELHKTTGASPYLEAAVRAADYVCREIAPAGKWFDYETFLSCSPKAYDFYDPITAQHPQNNMGTIQTAKALLALHRITGGEEQLAWGRRVLDYLSLTQQVWSHPRLTPNLIGGFTTQNTDAEWSDARQAHCAVLYLDYFEATGEREYLERGVAALRASFPVAPGENWAHFGHADVLGSVSGFHWGQGSGMASVEMVWARYGDVFVDIESRLAAGVNGCTAESLHVDGDRLSLSVLSDLQWNEPLRIVFRNPGKRSFAVSVNGQPLGSFGPEALVRGVSAPPGVLAAPREPAATAHPKRKRS